MELLYFGHRFPRFFLSCSPEAKPLKTDEAKVEEGKKSLINAELTPD